MLTKLRSGGGLLLLRRRAPLKRRSVAYFCSGAHTSPRTIRKSFTLDRQIEPLVMGSEIEGLDDLHAFLKLGNHVTWFSFPHMDRDIIAPNIVPRNIPEEDMWLRSLPPEAENHAVEQPVSVAASDARPPVATAPESVVAPSSQIVSPPSQLPGLPLFNQGQATATDPSTNM